jgi:hypothetical protein
VFYYLHEALSVGMFGNWVMPKKCDIVKETLLNHLFDIVLLQKQNYPPSILSI